MNTEIMVKGAHQHKLFHESLFFSGLHSKSNCVVNGKTNPCKIKAYSRILPH